MAGIKFDFTGDNKNLLNAAKQAQTGVTNAISAIERAGSGIESTFSKIKGSVLGGFSDIAKGMAGITAMLQAGNFLKTLVDDAAKFNVAMKEVSTLSEDVARNLQQYKGQVVDMTTQIPIRATEAANALYQIESAGHHGADGLNVLRESAKGAIGGVTDTATTADAITTILNAYKMEASEAQHVSDLLFTTVRLGKTNMSQLGTTIAQVAPVAASFGVSIEDVLAAIASLTKQGTKTSVAVRQVRDAITATTKSMGDNAFQGRSFLDAMDEVAQKAQGSNNALRQDLGTLQALNAVLSLTGKNSQAARQDVADMQNSAGAAEAAYKKMASNAGTQITLLRNNIFKNILPMADEIRSMSGDIARYMNEAFDSGAMDKAIVSLEAFIAAYATYRGLLTATTAWNSAALGGTYQLQIAELQQLIPLKELDGQADLQAAVAKGELSIEQAKLVASLRAETEARFEEVVAAEAEARSNLKALTVAEASAAANLAAAEEMVVSAQARVAAATQSGVATDIETAKEELNTAEMLKNDAMRQKSIITRQREGAQTMVNVTSKNAETAATLMNTTQQGVNATSTGVLATAKLQLSKAIKAVNASFLASPLFWIAATIAAVTYAVYQLVTAESAHDAAIRKSNEAMDEAKKKLDERRSAIDNLIRTIQDPNATAFEKEKAYDELRQVASDITDAYSKEAIASMKAADAQKLLNETMDEAAFKEAKKNVEEWEEKVESMTQRYEKYQKMSESGVDVSMAPDFVSGKMLEEAKTQLEVYKTALEKIISLREQAAKSAEEESKPIEIRIEEAKENESEKKRIFDFFDDVMVHVEDIQSSQNNLNFDEAQNKLDAYISEIQGELDDLHQQVQKNPLDQKLQMKEQEKADLLNKLLQWQDEMHAGGFTTIPLVFKADWGSAQAALNAATGFYQNLLNQTTVGGTKSMADLYKAAKTDYETALKEWRRVSNKKNAANVTQAEYNKAKTELAAKKTDFEAVGGDPDGKQAKAAAQLAKQARKEAEDAAKQDATIRQKLWDNERKEEEEIAAQRLAARNARRQAEIAQIKDDGERKRAEEEYQFQQDIDTIQRQAEEFKKKNLELAREQWEASNKDKQKVWADTDIAKAGWQGQSLTADQDTIIKAQTEQRIAERKRQLEEERKLERQYLYDYIKEYGSIQDQKEAITREYDEKIAEEGNTIQKAALQKQKENALKELDFKELQQSINWEAVFNDLDKLSKSALADLRKKLKDALDMKDITPENAKVLSEKLLEIDNRLSDNMWTSMIPALKERQRLVNEVKNAEEDIARAQQKVATSTIAQQKSQSSLQSLAKTLLGRNLTKEELASKSGSDLAQALKLTGESAKQLADSFDKNKTTTYDLTKAQEELTASQRQGKFVNEQLVKLTGKGANGQNFGSALTSIFKDAAEANGGGFMGYASLVQSNINSMAEFTDKIGLAGTDFGDAVHGFADGVNGFMGAIQSLASGDIFGAVNGVIDGFTGLGRAIDSIGGGFLFGDDDRYQEAIDKWGWVLDSWKDNIAYERELMEKAYGVKAIEASRDAVKAAQDAAKAAREIYEGWAGSGAGWFSHSNGHNVNDDVRWDLLRQYNTSWYRKMDGDVSNLFNLTWQELEKLKNEAPQFWSSIHSEAQKYLDQYIEAGKAAEETLTALNEQLTGTTKENVFDDFLSSLYDLADGAEDVTKDIADNWQKMVNRMVINNLIAKDFQDQLEKWYQRLADLQGDRAEGRINDKTYGNRLNDLLEEYNKLFGEADGKVEEFTKLGIIKPIEDATEKTSDFFSGLRDSFKSFFEDTEADAEEWSKNIAQQIAGDLIEQLVMTDEFDAWMEDWKKRYAEVLSLDAPDERGQRMQALIEELNAMRDKTGEKAKEIRESLGLIAEGEAGEESVFSNLRDTFLDTLTDIEQDAESFRKKLEETMIKDVLEKQVLDVPITINGMTFDNFDAYVTRWNERYTDAVESGNQAAIDALLEELMQAREITLEAAKELRERLKDVAEDTTFSDMSDNFVSTLMDMSKTADDWAQDLGRSIAKRIIEQMVVTTMVQPLLDNLQKAVDQALGMEGATYESAIGDAGVQGALKDIKDAFPGLQTLVRGIMESLGVTFDEIKEGFSDMRGSFVSALTDMEADAETFGKNIGKAMREQMLDAYIDKQYHEQLAAINEEWAEALESGDPERIDAIEQKVAELYATIGNDEAVKSLIGDIRELGKETEEADTTFSDMADSWTSALMDMDSDAKDWGKQIGRTLAEKIIKEMIVGKQLQPYLDAIQDAFNKAVSEEGATAESVMAAVTPEIDAATAAMERMNPVIKGIMEQLSLLDDETSVTPFDNLRSSYLSTLMDMSKQTKDWTKEISQMIAESFVDSFVLGSAFDEKLEEWKKRYKDITEDSSLSEEQRMKQLKTLSELIAADTEDSKKQVSEILKWLGIREGQDQSVTMNMAEAATYDQFELYLGMATSHLMVAEQTKSVTQQILSTLQSMSGITSPSENYGQQIFMRLGTTNEYLLAVKRATEAIRSEFATKLDIMNSHLSKL